MSKCKKRALWIRVKLVKKVRGCRFMLDCERFGTCIRVSIFMLLDGWKLNR